MEPPVNFNLSDISKKISLANISALGSSAVSAIGNGWHSVCWLFGTVCLSISLPCWLLTKLWMIRQHHKNRQKLQNKVVLITGASSGLGEALAHAFYRSGCRLVLAARREEELRRVREDLLRTHPTAPTHVPLVLPMDMGELNDMSQRVESILSIYGQIDIFVSNAGISCRCSVESCAMDVDVKLMLTNYFGHVALTKAILPSMLKKKSGHIVAVSSVQGRIALPHRSAYAASKHAVQAFSDSLRAEIAPHGINVTVVSPGYIKTNLSQNALTGEGKKYQKTVEGKKEDAEIGKKIIHTYPLIRHCDMTDEMKTETMELCVTACEKHSSNSETAAKMIKETMDKKFGPSWHAVVGEGFGMEITHECRNLLYMFFGGNMAVCVWKCS